MPSYTKVSKTLLEGTSLPGSFFTGLEKAISDSSFWTLDNTTEEADFNSPGKGIHVEQTEAAAALGSAIQEFFREQGFSIIIAVNSVDPSDQPSSATEQFPVGKGHRLYPNGIVVGGEQAIDKGRFVMYIHMAPADESYDPADVNASVITSKVARLVRHEIVHTQQFEKRRKKQKISRMAAKTEYEREGEIPPEGAPRSQYLSADIEVDAYAHEFAEELLNVLGKEKAFKTIKSKQTSDQLRKLGLSDIAVEYLGDYADADFTKKLRSKIYTQMTSMIEKGLYESVLRKLILSEGVEDPSIFKAIFLAGGPGSGKSTIVKKLVDPGRYGLKLVNVDAAFELFLKKSEDESLGLDMSLDTPETRSSRMKVFNKARSLTKKKQKNYIDGRLGLVIDGTGGSFNVIKKQKERLEALGYDTFMLYVDTSLEVSKSRNIKRGEDGGRRLRDDDLQRSWSAVNKNRESYQELFQDDIIIIDGDRFDSKQLDSGEKKVKAFISNLPRKPTALDWMTVEKSMKSSSTPQSVSEISKKGTGLTLLRQCIRSVLRESANVYSWEVSNEENMMLDKEGMPQTDKENQARFLKTMGLMSEGVEFHELNSPLRYNKSANVKRLAYCDASVTEPPSTRDAYFKEYQEWENYGKSGRRLKKARKGEMVPGVSNVCIIGFLDFHEYGENGWYIDYMKTRGDASGQGVASKLMDEFFARYAKPGGMIHFGKMMRKEIGHLKDKMEKQYPDITVIGAKNY